MSTRMLSDDHLRVVAIASALADVVGAREDTVRALGEIESALWRDVEAEKAGRTGGLGTRIRCELAKLHAANAAAFLRRKPPPESLPPGCTEEDAMRLRVFLSAPLTCIKLARSFEYQACDWDGYEGSEAQQIARRAIDGAATRLIGWDEAPWTI